jgi:branched-chain amino acid transport system permease protein
MTSKTAGTRLRRLRLPSQPMLRHLLLAVVGGVVLFTVTSMVGPYRDYQIALIGIDAVDIAGLSLLTGANGQISLGQGAFVMVGAYGAGMLLVHTKLPIALALLVGVVVSAAAGVLIGIPASRLRGPYLAGMTLALAIGLPAIPTKFASVFGGEQGLNINPPMPPSGTDPERWLSWIVLLAVLVMLVLLGNLMRSRFGRAFRAVRDDEVSAALSGISVGRTKVVAFAVSAGAAGLAGGLLGLTTGGVIPDAFSVALSISLLAGMVLGGTGSLLGAWWGAIILVFAPQWATSLSNGLHLRQGQSSNLALLFYGLVLIVVILVAPYGIQGGLRRLWALVARRFGGGDGGGPPGNGLTAGSAPVEPIKEEVG